MTSLRFAEYNVFRVMVNVRELVIYVLGISCV